MRRFPLSILPFLGLALLGNSCEFKAAVNNSLPSEQVEGPRDANGLLIVIRSGDPIEVPAAPSASAVVAVALSMSALSAAEVAVEDALASIRSAETLEWREAQGSVPSPPVIDRPAAAVPEPSGLLLFACGLGLVSIRWRRR